MFDKINIQTPKHTEYQSVPYEKVIIEKKAPTGESIKFYEDMQEKCYKKILDTIKIEDNVINAGSIVVDYNPMMNERIAMYRFTLNGNEITGHFSVGNFNLSHIKQEIIKQIYDRLSKEIAIKLMQSSQSEIINKI